MEEDWFEDNDDNDSFYEGDGPDYREEVAVYERVGLPGAGLIGEIPENKIERAMMDPLQRFRLFVDVISRSLMEYSDINESSINIMLEKAAELQAAEHKNPTAYILGYVASGGGRDMSRQNFSRAVKLISHVKDTGSVLPPDIIRYARLWQNLR